VSRRRVFYDLEFLENGSTIDPISIGMVDDQGREYYAVNELAPWGLIEQHPWLMANVVPSLPQLADAPASPNLRRTNPCGVDVDDPSVRLPGRIATDVRDFLLLDGPNLDDLSGGPNVELWAWYGAYDHVALCQLFGTMADLPRGIPMWTNDIRQEAHRAGNPALPEQPDGVHNALADARHNQVRFNALQAIVAEADSARIKGILDRASGITRDVAAAVQHGERTWPNGATA
jgi:hypothetical protein